MLFHLLISIYININIIFSLALLNLFVSRYVPTIYVCDAVLELINMPTLFPCRSIGLFYICVLYLHNYFYYVIFLCVLVGAYNHRLNNPQYFLIYLSNELKLCNYCFVVVFVLYTYWRCTMYQLGCCLLNLNSDRLSVEVEQETDSFSATYVWHRCCDDGFVLFIVYTGHFQLENKSVLFICHLHWFIMHTL